jgi:Rieske Fe-S protein
MADRPARWREDFPITWERDAYVSRRDLAKYMTLGSALLVGANAAIAVVGHRRRNQPAPPPQRIDGAAAVPPGGSLLFHYPTPDDPCILVRDAEGGAVAYSQVCTHLSCAVVYRPDEDCLLCPCHLGSFSCASGLPIAGPPTRRLPRIRLEERDGELWATGVEV